MVRDPRLRTIDDVDEAIFGAQQRHDYWVKNGRGTYGSCLAKQASLEDIDYLQGVRREMVREERVVYALPPPSTPSDRINPLKVTIQFPFEGEISDMLIAFKDTGELSPDNASSVINYIAERMNAKARAIARSHPSASNYFGEREWGPFVRNIEEQLEAGQYFRMALYQAGLSQEQVTKLFERAENSSLRSAHMLF